MIEIMELLKILSDKTRLRILNLLNKGKKYVCELVLITELPQSTISRHLAKMRLANIVKTERNGQLIKYEINKELFEKYEFLKILLERDAESLEEIKRDNMKTKDIAVKNNKCLL